MATALKFKSAVDAKNKPILKLVKGIKGLDDKDAEAMGLNYQEPAAEDGGDGYFFFEHPRNEAAVTQLQRVCKAAGYRSEVEILDYKGNASTQLLLPEKVPTLQAKWTSVFGGDVVQAPDEVLSIVHKLVTKHHRHLANAAILVVMEDYEPEEMAATFGKYGEVWGFCTKLGGEFARLTGYDFKITLCTEVWNRIDDRSRVWLCDHELMHAGRSNGKWHIIDHDIEMFLAETERYGDVKALAEKHARLMIAAAKGESAEDAPAKPKKKKKNESKELRARMVVRELPPITRKSVMDVYLAQEAKIVPLIMPKGLTSVCDGGS